MRSSAFWMTAPWSAGHDPSSPKLLSSSNAPRLDVTGVLCLVEVGAVFSTRRSARRRIAASDTRRAHAMSRCPFSGVARG